MVLAVAELEDENGSIFVLSWQLGWDVSPAIADKMPLQLEQLRQTGSSQKPIKQHEAFYNRALTVGTVPHP